MASDGHKAWIIKAPARCKVLDRMTKAIQNWDLDADRNINYRSFEPILQLAQVRHTPQCAHWAAWALANLTRVYRKYIIYFFLCILPTYFVFHKYSLDLQLCCYWF